MNSDLISRYISAGGKRKRRNICKYKTTWLLAEGLPEKKKREKSTGDISYPLDGGEEVFVGSVNQTVRPVDTTRSEKRCI
jgi:hypothetical protein